MGCNIPRPRKRRSTPNDAMYGYLTASELRRRYGLDPAVKPIYINGEEIGNVETREKDPAPEPTPYNCPNCCAPIIKEYCEYCGTRFGFTVVKVDGVKKKEEIERLKKAINGEKTLLFADNAIVAEFHRFSSIAHDLGDSPKLPIQKQR